MSIQRKINRISKTKGISNEKVLRGIGYSSFKPTSISKNSTTYSRTYNGSVTRPSNSTLRKALRSYKRSK